MWENLKYLTCIGVSAIVLSLSSMGSTMTREPQMPASLANGVLSEGKIITSDTLVNTDSVNEPKFLPAAIEAYKHLKFIQYDGVVESELYPAAFDTYEKIMAALPETIDDEQERIRCKHMLVDISDLLQRGALYYSAEGKQDDMTKLATAYVDLRLNPEMSNMSFGNATDGLYPALVYCAASSAYNNGHFDKASDYLEEYLKTGAKEHREQVTLFLGQAGINAHNPSRVADRMISAVDEYPANFNILMLALQACLDSGTTERMQPLLTKALTLRPDDEVLLNAQGRLYEEAGNYTSAIDVYQRLYEKKPNSLPINRHLALCYYNLGADYYNKAIMSGDEKQSQRYSRQSKAYFETAANKLETVIENDPTNAKYLKALAITYGCLGNRARLDETNVRLQALGMPQMPMNGMPESIVYAEAPSNSASRDNAKSAGSVVPSFQDFAKAQVEKKLGEWTQRGEFEKQEDFEKRVTSESVYQQYKMLCKQAENDYLHRYTDRLRISDLTLQPYDADNESYLIESALGPIVVHVPLKNKEAEAFKSAWNSIQLHNPRYYIKDNHVAIASVDLVTSAGKTYSYNAENASNYDFTDVRIDVESFINQGNSKRNRTASYASSDPGAVKTVRAKSDVDENIPITTRKAENTIALIIGNENYKQVIKVESALNDADIFAKYCTLTLGIPENQVLVYNNATYAEMIGAMQKLRQLVGALGDNIEVIVYYAGHGFPDEKDKDAYLLPVDGDGFTTATSYPLKKLYADLTSLGADNVIVFLDACFSGATRDGGMLANTRGVALKAKETLPEGNMYVLSAASDQETALPYKEKNHGLFTYFLLKKLQETKGNVTLMDLSKYVEENVKKNSMTVNRKLQTPRTMLSGNLRETWANKKLR